MGSRVSVLFAGPSACGRRARARMRVLCVRVLCVCVCVCRARSACRCSRIRFNTASLSLKLRHTSMAAGAHASTHVLNASRPLSHRWVLGALTLGYSEHSHWGTRSTHTGVLGALTLEYSEYSHWAPPPLLRGRSGAKPRSCRWVPHRIQMVCGAGRQSTPSTRTRRAGGGERQPPLCLCAACRFASCSCAGQPMRAASAPPVQRGGRRAGGAVSIEPRRCRRQSTPKVPLEYP